MVPIQIRAQLLRSQEFAPQSGALAAFAIVPDVLGDADNADPVQRGPWRQSDVKRAIAAAEQAGLESYRVEIAPDGTISIVVGAPADTAATGDSDGDPSSR